MKEKSINEKVGEQLRLLRGKNNLSQESLGLEIKVSPSTISNIENGSTPISIERLYEILVILKSDIIEFFSEVENIPRNHVTSEAIKKYSREEIREIVKSELENQQRDK